MNTTSSIMVCPACGKHLSVMELEPGIIKEVVKEKGIEPIRKIVEAWKILIGIPIDQYPTWDKEHYPRSAAAAKSLLNLFGTVEHAVNCIEYVHDHFKKQGFNVTLNGIVKHSDLYREVMDRK